MGHVAAEVARMRGRLRNRHATADRLRRSLWRRTRGGQSETEFVSAARRGIHIDWKRHARTGVPVTLATLAICAVSLWWGTSPAA